MAKQRHRNVGTFFGLLENTAVFRFFGNWPVAYRVSAIAATGALGLCAVGVLYAIGSQWQRGHEQAAVAGTEQLARVTSVVIRTQELRLTHLRATTGAIPEATIADLARGLHLDLNQLDPALAATATRCAPTARTCLPAARCARMSRRA